MATTIFRFNNKVSQDDLSAAVDDLKIEHLPAEVFDNALIIRKDLTFDNLLYLMQLFIDIGVDLYCTEFSVNK